MVHITLAHGVWGHVSTTFKKVLDFTNVKLTPAAKPGSD